MPVSSSKSRHQGRSGRQQARVRRRRYWLELERLEKRDLPSGTWTPLVHSPPDNMGTLLLLTDGTVMAQGGSVSKHWYKLTPDSSGSYINGTWTSLASMSIERLYAGTVVLPNGQVLYVGGEYTGPNQNQTETNTGEIYDPVANTWSPIASFPEANFGDAPLELLYNGNVLGGFGGGPQTFLYNPQNNTWSAEAIKVRSDATSEETWIKLPDNSILEADINASVGSGIPFSQRYIPSTNTWVDAGTIPVPLTNSEREIGPGLLLPDGRVFQVGDTGNTALYNTSTNKWAAGPSVPGNLAGDDDPGAILPNGHVIFSADTAPYTPPTKLFDFDPVANTITPLSLPSELSSNLNGGVAFADRMLILPSGDLLFSDGSGQLWDYHADGIIPTAWAPTVSSVNYNSNTHIYTLTGTQLNGLSEGASFGDDAQMSSNYPIVRLTSANNTVYYARTFDWNSLVATGSTPVSTQFSLPTGLPVGVYSLTVIANGISSAPYSLPVGLSVTSSTPANSSSLPGPPTAYSVTFSQPINPTSLQASALTVNGIVATNVTVDSTSTVATFTFSTSPVTAQGAQQLNLASGAAKLQSNATVSNTSYNATFYYDALPLAIASTNPASGTTLPPPVDSLTYDVTFNEPIDAGRVALNNLTLSMGTVTAAKLLPGNETVAYTITGLTEGMWTASIAVGTFVDQYDNPTSPSLTANYLLDDGTDSLNAGLATVAPTGSLVYKTSTSSTLLFAGDTDQYTLTADPGQTITVLVTPNSAALTPQIQVVDPSGTTLTDLTASGAGQPIVVQAIPTTTSGTYTINVSGQGGTVGNYTIQFLLNAALGMTNSALATAQDIDSSFVSLGGLVSRGAVISTKQTSSADVYGFTLTVGDSVSLGLKNLSGGSASLALEDGTGKTLAVSAAGASFDQLVNNYLAPETGIYYAVITSGVGVSYSVVVTRNAALDAKTNSTFTGAQNITGTTGGLGALTATVPDWYQITLFGAQNALQLMTSTPLGGPSQGLNLLYPGIQLYDASNNVVAVGSLLADGRNQALLATGLTQGATYYIKVVAANNTSGEYFLSVTSPVAIVTRTLPNWTAGQPGFAQTISATSATSPTGSLAFSITGTLPTGLTLSTGGALTGTPNVVGAYSFTITATDSLGVSGSRAYAILISAPVTITSATLSNGTIGYAYNQTIATSGGTVPLTFSATGTLPPGLTLSSTGVLAGTPTDTGSYSFTVSVLDNVGVSDQHTYTIAVFALSPSALPPWTVNVPGFSQTFSASGGVGPYMFSTSGALPAGLTLSSTGVLSGTPSTVGMFSFLLMAMDSTSVSAEQSYTLVINAPVMALPTSLASWTASASGYRQTIFADGGTGSLTFVSMAGLPGGLTLSGAGVLTGTPTTAGNFNFIVDVTDTLGATASRTYAVTINPVITFTPAVLPAGTVDFPYNPMVAVLGGTGNKVLTLIAINNPISGLFVEVNVNNTFTVLGTPNASGTETFTMKATDQVAGTSSQVFTILINPAVTIQTTTISNATQGTPYRQTIVAAGGTAPLTFSTTGNLPAGLSFTTTGVLAGTPTGTGKYSFSITANDSIGAASTQAYTLVINPPIAISTTSLVDWTVNQPTFNQTILATGGTGNLTFAITAGTVPPGKLLSTNGVFVGTPTATGDFSFTVTVTDTVGSSSSETFKVTINPPIALSTATLTSWTANQSGYSQTISTVGGTGTKTFAETGILPVGLTLSTDGVLAGTPSMAGMFTFTVTANDETGASGSQTYTLDINVPATFVPVTLPGGTINTAYNQVITSFGGTGTVLMSIGAVSGTIPGVMLSGSGTDIITVSGTPTTMGSESFTITATDAVGAVTSQGFILEINPALSITTATLSAGTIGAAYSQMVETSGGTSPATFSTPSTGLPPGLTLSSSGVIGGTPTMQGTFSFTVSATDAAGSTTSQLYTVAISPAVMLTSPSLDSWTINLPGYDKTIAATGGTGSLTFSATGTLPNGLSLSSSGVLSGTPTVTGTFPFVVTATDVVGGTGSQNYSVVINPAPNLTPGVLPSSAVNTPYNRTITGNGGTGVVTLAVSNVTGVIPGLKLPNTGSGSLLISGTPTAAGTTSFTVTASDSVGAMVSQSYSITITPATVFLSLPSTGFSGSPGGIVATFPISINQLQDQASTNHVGLASATLAVTFPTGVFAFPVGGSQATAEVSLGSVPLSDTASPGGAADWLLSANSPADGQLNITLTAKSGKSITSNNPANGGSLVTISFPVSANLNITAPSPEPITVATVSGSFHTNISGSNGTYILKPSPPYTGSITVRPASLQVIPGSFIGSPSGFSLAFNQSYLVNATSPVLYGRGFGVSGTAPSVIVTTDPANLNDLAAYVSGSLLLNAAHNAITFLATDTENSTNSTTNGGAESPLLPDGIYTVIIRSGMGNNGFQALNPAGGYLDGLGTGMPGSGDYTATFTVTTAASGNDVLWVPSTADGPGQPLSAPGMNRVGGGYPIYLTDSTGAVTDVQATLNYDATLLNVTGVTGTDFSLLALSIPGQAILEYNGPALPAGSQTPIGFLTATVPGGTPASPMPYKAKDLLHLSNVALNGGAIPVVTSDAVHLVAYVGDGDGSGSYTANDALLITRALLNTDSGFAAYPLVDPVIVADIDGSGFIPADAALQANEATVGVPAPNLPVPPIPSGVFFEPITNSAAPAVPAPFHGTSAERLDTSQSGPGTWTPLVQSAPDNIGLMLLLTDGTVMAQGGDVSRGWYQLRPDSTGSYINGTWTVLASMSLERLYGGTAVLPSGKVLYVGGEYTGPSQTLTDVNTGEIYDPLSKTWSAVTPYPEPNFGDNSLEVLADGTVLGGYINGPQTFVYDPSTDSWSPAGTKLRSDPSDEETWIKLPDGSILSADIQASLDSGTPSSQRYVPGTDSWVDAGTIPVALTNSEREMGPGLLLPDGRVFQLGGNGQTALYTPSTNQWAAGPPVPGGLSADDAPGALLPNGHVIFAADLAPYTHPTELFDFDPGADTISPMSLPTGLSSVLATWPAYVERMLVLPTGEMLLSDDTGQLWDYSAGGTTPTSWQPTISSVVFNASSDSYTLTGTQLNGITEGASYGDDAQMATNYPIVRLTGADGTVYTARTFGWTSVVASGSTPVTTQFTLPSDMPAGVYSLTVVANGIASNPVSLSVQLNVVSSTPAGGTTTASWPATYQIAFSQAVDPTRLQARAFTVNGLAATGVKLDATDTVATFSFSNNPVTGPGSQVIALAPGAARLLADSVVMSPSFSAIFTYTPTTVSLSMPKVGFGGTPGGTVAGFPIDISALQDQASTNHVGLASATFAITFPTGVYDFPVGGERASVDVNFGSVPLSDAASPGGAADWLLSADSPADGQLNITLTARSGKDIMTDNPAMGGSLVTINFPVSTTYSATAPTAETITLAALSGSFQTTVTGDNGPYVLMPAPLATGSIVISPSLQVVPGSFVGTPSGFSLQFNQPYLVDSQTPVLYGRGFGASGTSPSVIVTRDPANLSDTAAYVAGSLVFDRTNSRLTFVATSTENLVLSNINGSPGSPVLPDGTYTVILRSSATESGFQALSPSGSYLDGLGTGIAGSGDYIATFTVSAAAAGDDVVWLSPTANGPGQVLNAPGKNQVGGGYPIYLDDSTGSVTDVQVTLNYDPTLLDVTGVAGTGFTFLNSSLPGQAVLEYSGPTLTAGEQTPIGFLVAVVPSGTAANPVPYRAEDLLHLSNVSLNGGAIPVVTSDALHLVAYVGDADGNGSYSANDAVLITRALLNTDTGFSAYPVVDPVIITDTDGAGFIPADAALQVNEAGVGFPTANLPIPPIPGGIVFTLATIPAAQSVPLPRAQLAIPHYQHKVSTTQGLPVITWVVPTRRKAPGFIDVETAVLDEYFAAQS